MAAQHVLALQRSAGNAAVTRVLQRKFRPDGSGGWLFDFTVGDEISQKLATEAFARTRGGALGDDDLAELRELALDDRSVDDNERLFLAALMDPANAAKLQAITGFGAGSTVTFASGTITEANRARVRDFGREEESPTPMAIGAKRPGAEQRILSLAGSRFEATAKQVIRLATASKVPHERVYEAMLAAASDSTAGDRVLAGAAYVIARRAGSPMADKLLLGSIKVDEVPASEIQGTAEYVSMSTLDKKGDTIYLPSDLDVESLAHQGLVVHELAHAARDEAQTQLVSFAVDDTELEGYRAQARYWLNGLRPLKGPKLTTAISKLAPAANNLSILAMMLEDRANGGADILLVDQVNRAAAGGLSGAAWARAFGLSTPDLEQLAKSEIRNHPVYRGKSRSSFGGLQGDSFLDE